MRKQVNCILYEESDNTDVVAVLPSYDEAVEYLDKLESSIKRDNVLNTDRLSEDVLEIPVLSGTYYIVSAPYLSKEEKQEC